MNGLSTAGHEPVAQPDEGLQNDAIRSIAGQFAVIQGSPERVAECCRHLERGLADPPGAADLDLLRPLLPLLAGHSGPIVAPLFEFLARVASSCSGPWPLLAGMIASREHSLVVRSLEIAARRVADGSMVVDRAVVLALAELADVPGSCVADPDCLRAVAALVRRATPPAGRAQLDALFAGDPDARVRKFAARILDIGDEPIPPSRALKALGEEAHSFLAPYLVFTRASHADVAFLVSSPGAEPPALGPLRRAEAVLGRELLRSVIARAGWPRLNAGIEVRRHVRVTAGDSLPLILRPVEAALAAGCGDVKAAPVEFLVVVEGGSLALRAPSGGSEDPASRFRSYNLAHARVLSDFLAIAPLTPERVGEILGRMDAIVGDYAALFSSLSDECSILGSVYGRLREAILRELTASRETGRISPDLTRLTVMFEDPRSLGQVRTLHGLKRYLHQSGLQLGFRLVGRARSTNRTVGLLHISGDRIVSDVETIRYSDFEPDAEGGTPADRMPYAVSLAADGFARQMLQGQEGFPKTDIFCYGNEVHYYLAFGNHPAFLRINYAPPLQGGMIDLEYYGVSKYDLASHPDFSLSALQGFFRALGFQVSVENTRVHARYDKEQTSDLKSLCEKAAALLCLAPYLLDIDWTIGGLDLDWEGRRTVAARWAASFAAWGVLPLGSLLTGDRRSVISGSAATATGREEHPWTGTGPYRDRFHVADGDFVRNLFDRAARLLPEIGPMRPPKEGDRVGQLLLEREIFIPLCEGAARGELLETPGGFARAPSARFGRVTAPERFAQLIAEGGRSLDDAAALAYLVAPLERYLSFRAAGTVGGCDVQSARLPLQGGDLGVHIFRGETNLAFFTPGTVICRRRDAPDSPWESNAFFDAPGLLSLLRRANYPVTAPDRMPPDPGEGLTRMRAILSGTPAAAPRPALPGDRVIVGLRASPGGAVGWAIFGTDGRAPGEFDGAVLITPALQASDAAFLHRAAAVVSTGGGILSHAALLAAQFRKPAMIIGGHWEDGPGGARSLHYTSTEYRLEESTIHGIQTWSRTNTREVGHILREGDLVALDAGEDLLRVLGQGGDTLALHEGFRQFGLASHDLARAANDRDILLFRGRRIRARHQIEKVLSRVADPVLACHAVHELLLDSAGLGRNATGGEKARMMNILLSNPLVAGPARDHLRWTLCELRQRSDRAARKAGKRIPDSGSIYEIIGLRLDALRAAAVLEEAGSCLEGCGVGLVGVDADATGNIERLARGRIASIRRETGVTLGSSGAVRDDARPRHIVRAWERADLLVAAPDGERRKAESARARLSASDASVLAALQDRTIVHPEDGGLELSPLIGWKGANLAEIARVTGRPLVPPWFAVTDLAFRQVLRLPVGILRPGVAQTIPAGAPTLREAIEAVLADRRADPVQQSSSILALWESVVLPETLAAEVAGAYRRLGGGGRGEDEGEPLVALRSSSHEEDTELAMRAGEFDTFLYIRGERQLLEYLLRTWSGLWSERALHARGMSGTKASFAGGGVVVQRMVDSRVSGVVQTINVARNEFREIVINAGLGLGEGIVSGTVAADHVVVAKESDPGRGPLRFTYNTADKQEYIVFNRRAGFGTMRRAPPYHQRMRPALEYQELVEIVEAATSLEAAYGYPLDIEFAIEGERLWILQARPVPSTYSFLQETLDHHPLRAPGGAAPHGPPNGEPRR